MSHHPRIQTLSAARQRMCARPWDSAGSQSLPIRVLSPAHPATPDSAPGRLITLDPPAQDTLDRRIPPELLGLISKCLQQSDIFAFRAVSRELRDGAHHGWCRSIDTRSFAVTCRDAHLLLSNVERTGCGVHMKTLRIDIQLACQCQYAPLMSNLDSSGRVTTFNQMLRDDSWGFGRSSDCRRALRKAVRQMPNLRTIELSLYRQRSDAEAYATGGFIRDLYSIERSLLVPQYAVRLAFDAVAQSLFDCWCETLTQPRITTLNMPGPIPLGALPACSSSARATRLFDHLTKVHLTIAAPDLPSRGLFIMHGIDMGKYVPRFLASLPQTLQDLSCSFPKDKFLLGSSWSEPPVFGNKAFDAVVKRHLYFPNLSTLHFANLSLSNLSLLKTFLGPHAHSLSHFRGTNLALSINHWRPFLSWLGSEMKLDRLVFDLDMSEDEIAMRNEFWRRSNPLLRPSNDEYLSAAKNTSVNGNVLERGATKGSDENGYVADEESNAESI